jgi:hypothetical protein
MSDFTPNFPLGTNWKAVVVDKGFVVNSDKYFSSLVSVLLDGLNLDPEENPFFEVSIEETPELIASNKMMVVVSVSGRKL